MFIDMLAECRQYPLAWNLELLSRENGSAEPLGEMIWPQWKAKPLRRAMDLASVCILPHCLLVNDSLLVFRVFSA